MPNFTDLAGLASVASATAASLLLLPGIARPSAKHALMKLLAIRPSYQNTIAKSPVMSKVEGLRTGLTKPHLAILLGAMFVLMLIPFGTLPIAAYVRGATGDLSITTLVLLWCALLKPWRDCVTVEAKHRLVLLILIALAALALYPMALGVGAYDPYRLGYGNPQFVAALLLLALAAWFWKSTLIALCIAFATLAWSVGWYESDNLWDYLLDPFLSVYALAAIIICGVRTLLKRQRD